MCYHLPLLLEVIYTHSSLIRQSFIEFCNSLQFGRRERRRGRRRRGIRRGSRKNDDDHHHLKGNELHRTGHTALNLQHSCS